MSPKVQQILATALQLNESERADLAEQLWQSLGSFADKDVETAWIEEIERRTAELDTGAVQAIPWEQVRKQIEEALSKRNESAA